MYFRRWSGKVLTRTPRVSSSPALILITRGQISPRNYRVSALQAFWPAVQAAVGDLKKAERTYEKLLGLWNKFGALPDFYDVQHGS